MQARPDFGRLGRRRTTGWASAEASLRARGLHRLERVTIDSIPPPTPRPVVPDLGSAPLRPPSSSGLDEAVLSARNPFFEAPAPVRSAPTGAEAARALDQALRADPQRAESRAAVLRALLDLQRADLSALSTDEIDALFRQLAAAVQTWPDATWARDLVAVAVATLAVHLSWKNDGLRVLQALGAQTLDAFRALARFVDAHADTYGQLRDAARADVGRRAAAAGMAVLTDGTAEREDLSLEAALDALIAQTRRYGGLEAPAEGPEVAAGAGLRSLAFSVTIYAESRKRAALQQLEQGRDLSQAAIMRLQEDLQAANQLIMAMSQILRKEGELGEQLARNIA